MKTISKNSDLLPGYVKLIAIPVWNISSIAANRVNVISNNDVYFFQCSIDSIHHDAKQIEGDHGPYFEHSVTATIQGYNDQAEGYLNSIQASPVVLLMQQDDASWIRLGDTECALVLTRDFTTQKPGYDISFTGELTYKSMPNETQSF
ncbi:MAG: hypothetical protein AB7C90_02460 [Bacteroidales bacterium]